MKKIKISIGLLVAIIIGIVLLLQIPAFATTGKSTATNVRVRKTASTNSEVLDLLAINDVVEILEEEGDWYKVSFNGKTGYVSKSFISTNDKIEKSKSEETKVNESKAEENTTQNEDSAKKEDNQSTENLDEQKDEEKNNREENDNQNSEDNTEEIEEKDKADIEDVTNNENDNKTSTSKVYKMAEDTKMNILPVVTSEYIGETKKDDEVTVISNAGLWAYIQSGSLKGWVRVDKLTTESATDVIDDNKDDKENKEDYATENTDANESTDNAQNNESSDANKSENNDNTEAVNYTSKTMYTKVAAVNVRSQSNTSSDVVTSIGINVQVNVVGEENGWYKVEVNGKSGFIRNDLLSEEKTEVTSRGNDIDRTTAAQTSSVEVTTTKQTETKTTTTKSAKSNTTASNTTKSNTTKSNNSASSDSAESTTKSSSGVTGEDIVAYAKKFVGYRYVYGAAGPNSFDCSGFTMYVYKHFGYSLSHSSKVQATQGKKVTGNLQPGDILVFSNDGKTVGHVGIYIGNDKFIHAQNSSTGVCISNLSDSWNKSKYWGARRIL